MVSEHHRVLGALLRSPSRRALLERITPGAERNSENDCPRHSKLKAALLGAVLLNAVLAQADSAQADQTRDPSSIPFSSIASPEARRAWETRNAVKPPFLEKYRQIDRMTQEERRALTLEARAWEESAQASKLAAQKAAYKVDIAPATIGGVYTEIFTPALGISPGNADRILINLHGGAFTVGARINGQIESIPIAAVGRIKVISVDYRLAPEHQFPAATDDVLAVYRELLKTYKPGNIGIYGCSSGGTLTAQVVAAVIAKKMPRPGAIGMFCGTGEIWAKGDSAYFWALLNGFSPGSAEHDPRKYDYLRGLDIDNPLIFPMRYPGHLGAFPPSLFITGTRAFEMSTIIDANNKLVSAGVDTSLHIWDGVMHGFFNDPTLPESREAYDVIARFFAQKLGPWYREELQKFLVEDLASGRSRCGVLFTGSSSIKFWTSLEQDMAPAKPLNRGFGGSTIAEINEVFDYVITSYWPKAIFFYAGENDLSAYGRSPGEVLAAFERFMAMKTARLGDVPVYFLSIKPSKLRWNDLGLQREANRLIERLAARRDDLDFVDVATPMIDRDKVRDIFRPDDLHMAPEGYRIWTSALRPLVLREDARPAPACEAAFSRNSTR